VVPDQVRLARAVAPILKPRGQFGIVNWHRRRRGNGGARAPRGPGAEIGWRREMWRQSSRRRV
jgi:hypothetical protein